MAAGVCGWISQEAEGGFFGQGEIMMRVVIVGSNGPLQKGKDEDGFVWVQWDRRRRLW